MPFKTEMSLRAVLTREAKTIRLGRDALNALYKLVFISAKFHFALLLLGGKLRRGIYSYIYLFIHTGRE